jgi:hypothetical protein
MRTYLSNTQQGSGEIILSQPLQGEGRTQAERGITAMAIDMPASAASADDALYGFAHEASQQVTLVAIANNVSSAQRREGAFDLYGANAAVRGGALLLQRVLPGSVVGYMTYYLRAAGVTTGSGDPTLAFEKEFPLPNAILDGITKQLATVLGGA